MPAWPNPAVPEPYDAMLALSPKGASYDASVAKRSPGLLPPAPDANPANPVAPLRC